MINFGMAASKIARTALFTSCAAILMELPAYAAPAAEDAVMNLVNEMKKSGDMSPVVEKIDWDTRFKSMSAAERKALGFNNASEMKSHYMERAKANGADQAEQISEELKGADSALALKKGSGSPSAIVERELSKQQSEFRTRMSGTSYTIVNVERQDDGTAIVTLKKSYKDQTEEVAVKVRQANGDWLVDSGAAFSPEPTQLSAGSPIGRVPEPAIVLGQP